MKKILCMGSINIDLTMFTKDLPKPGETIKTDNFQTFPGGKGGNQSATIGKLGGDVKFLTKLSDDLFSKQLLEEQKKLGVDVSPVIIEKSDTAGVAMIMVDDKAQNSILFTPGANAKLTAKDVLDNSSVFDSCDILEITMEIPTETCYQAIRIAKEKGLIVVLDPAPAPKEGIPKEIYKLVDYIKPNETETEILTGIKVVDLDSAKKGLNELISLGVKNPIISLGKQGCIYKNKDNEIEFVKSVDMKSIDTTAAGDIFLAGFTYALSNDKSMKYCIDFANVIASLSTTKKGAQTSIPTLEQVLDLFEES
ncbi:MAG: ribokinase [Pleomorphochaeta sp.]